MSLIDSQAVVLLNILDVHSVDSYSRWVFFTPFCSNPVLTSLIFHQERSPICERPLKKSSPPKKQYLSCSSPTFGKWRMSFTSLPWNNFSLRVPTPSEKRMENFSSWLRTSSMKRFIQKSTECAARQLCKNSVRSHLHWEEKSRKFTKSR